MLFWYDSSHILTGINYVFQILAVGQKKKKNRNKIKGPLFNCIVGLQAIAHVAAAIKMGQYEIGIAGGVESMSLNGMGWDGNINEDAMAHPVASGKLFYLILVVLPPLSISPSLFCLFLFSFPHHNTYRLLPDHGTDIRKRCREIWNYKKGARRVRCRVSQTCRCRPGCRQIPGTNRSRSSQGTLSPCTFFSCPLFSCSFCFRLLIYYEERKWRDSYYFKRRGNPCRDHSRWSWQVKAFLQGGRIHNCRYIS